MATGVLNALPQGFELEGYRVEQVLGTGGFGITYRAAERSIKRQVAIKEYLPRTLAVRDGDSASVRPVSNDDTGDFDYGLERFRDEAQTLVSLRHPNIVQVLKFFEANGTAYLVMDFVDGESLGGILKRHGTLTEDELHEVLAPLLEGIEYIHKAGFLHRDIKPDNIYIRYDGTPVMLDFGSARQALGQKSKTLTAIVTGGYAPFEQYTTGRGQGPWSDIYAMGATLYRASAGVSPPEATDRIMDDKYVPAGEAAEGVFSETFLAAVDAALAVRPADRPQTVADWRNMFDASGLAGGREKAAAESDGPHKVEVKRRDDFDATTHLAGDPPDAASAAEPQAEARKVAGDLDADAGRLSGAVKRPPFGEVGGVAAAADVEAAAQSAAGVEAKKEQASGGTGHGHAAEADTPAGAPTPEMDTHAITSGAWSLMGCLAISLIGIAMVAEGINSGDFMAVMLFASLALAYGFWATRGLFIRLGFVSANKALLVPVVLIPLSALFGLAAAAQSNTEDGLAIAVFGFVGLAVAFGYFGVHASHFGRKHGGVWRATGWLYVAVASMSGLTVLLLIAAATDPKDNSTFGLLNVLTLLSSFVLIAAVICQVIGLFHGARRLPQPGEAD